MYLCIYNRKKVPTLLPSGRKEECFFTQPKRDCHNSVNEKPLHFELPVSSNGLFVHNSLTQLSLLLYKRKFSFVSQDLPMVFAVAFLS